MTQSMTSEHWYKVIFEALETGGGIERIVEDISRNLHIPIAVIDAYGKTIVDAYTPVFSGNQKKTDEERQSWKNMIEQCYAQSMQQTTNGEYLTVLQRVGSEIWAMSAIFIKGGLEGFCITCHSDHSEEEIRSLNQLICRTIVAGYGKKDYIYTIRDSGAKQMLSKFFLAEDIMMEWPKIDESMYDAYMIPPYLLVQIDLKKEDIDHIWRIRNTISDSFPDALIYTEGCRINVLCVHVDSKAKCGEIERFFRHLAEEKECACALSESFELREEIRVKRQMVYDLMRIGKTKAPETNVYTEYQYYLELICFCAKEQMGHLGCFSRELMMLEQEDNEKGTEFYKTLKEYLLMGNNVNLAAKKLFIHRNTMVYRLSKIHELLQIDLNDPEVSKRLMMSMILRDLPK